MVDFPNIINNGVLNKLADFFFHIIHYDDNWLQSWNVVSIF